MTIAMRLRQPASLENLYLDTVEAPPPGPDEIRVRVRAASLNFRDCLIVAGFFPASDGLIPLSDSAGEVTDVGSAVTASSPAITWSAAFTPAGLTAIWNAPSSTVRPAARQKGLPAVR